MTQDEIIEMAKQAWISEQEAQLITEFDMAYISCTYLTDLVAFAKLVAAKEREALEAELLKLKQGVAANSDYIQGRWDLIGEFQDIIRARGDNQ